MKFLKKLSNDQKRIAKAIALYALVYPIAMQLFHWIRTKSFDWGDFLVAILTAVVIGVLCIVFFVVGSHVPTKDE